MRYIALCFFVLSSLAFSVPHPRDGIFLKKADITVRPYAKKGHCRVFFKMRKFKKDSGEISCNQLYTYLNHELGNLYTMETVKIRIDAANEFRLRIHLHKGKIISHRLNGLQDEFYVTKGSIHLADHPDAIERLYKEKPMQLNLEDALKELEETLK